jgi:hypothetical protein
VGYCTGSGEANGDHCCYTGPDPTTGAQRVCPHLMDNAATVAWINAQGWGATKRNAALNYATGIVWMCRIGLQVLADVTAARNNRARYEQEFAASAAYQAFPAPYWREVEAATGQAAGSMDCFRWQGELDPAAPGGGTCCYRRTTAQSDADAAARGISTQAVTVRKAGGKAD